MSSQISDETPLKNLIEIILTNRSNSNELFDFDVMFEILKWQKLDIKSAKTVFTALVKLGLETCRLGSHYDIQKFALMRNYFTESEIDRITKQAKKTNRKRT